jgi:hypothetical protein
VPDLGHIGNKLHTSVRFRFFASSLDLEGAFVSPDAIVVVGVSTSSRMSDCMEESPELSESLISNDSRV